MNELSKQDDFKVFQFLNVPAEDFSEVSLKHQVNKKMKRPDIVLYQTIIDVPYY
jgi:hypothetical protein